MKLGLEEVEALLRDQSNIVINCSFKCISCNVEHGELVSSNHYYPDS